MAHLDPIVFVGARASQIWPLILGDAIENWDIAQLERYADYKLDHPTPYGQCVFPGTKSSFCPEERGLSLAVASNTDLKSGESNELWKLSEILSYFDHHFSAMDCIACKPHPAVYEKAWSCAGTGKSRL